MVETMIDVGWTDFSDGQETYFVPYDIPYPVVPQSTWATGGQAKWPAGSGPDTGKVFVLGSDDPTTYNPATDILVFGFREGDAIREMNAHNYCVLWEQQDDGLWTLNVMPVSLWESTSPIASVTGLDAADLPNLIESWVPTNNHFQDDLTASVFSLANADSIPGNHIAILTHEAGKTTTYDFATYKTAYGNDVVLNFVTMTGRELDASYDADSQTLTIRHYGEGWGGYNDVWGQTVITNISIEDLAAVETLWRRDAASDDGRLLQDRFAAFVEAEVAAAGVDPGNDGTDDGTGDGSDSGTGDGATGDGGREDGGAATGQVDLSVDDWGSGFVARFKFTPEVAVSGGWTASLAVGATVTNIWNADIVSHENGVLVVRNVGYNANIGAGQFVEVGFQGAGSSAGLALIETDLPIGQEDPGEEPRPPTLSISDVTVNEGDGSATFVVTASGTSSSDISFDWQTVAGTAGAADYGVASGTAMIVAGDTQTSVTVALTDDTEVESTENFTVELSSAIGATLADASATATIYDNDVDDTGDGGTGDGGTGDGGTGDGGPFIGGGQTYYVGQTSVVTDFDPATDVLDLGPDSIHNQIPVDTPDGFMLLHMFNASKSLLLQGVHLADLHAENFAPISDAHLQQDLSAVLAYENGTGLVRPNTIYIRSHEQGLVETVDFNPATDKISFFYLSVRGDGQRNFAVEDTAEGARFYNPLTGQSLTLRDVSFSELDSSHFEWRANQLEDGIAGRMGLDSVIDGFAYVSENIFSGKSVAMAGLVDRAPYHSQPEYTGTPIGSDSNPSDPGDGGTGDGGTGDGGTGDGGTGDGGTGDGSGGNDGSAPGEVDLSVDDWGSGFVARFTFTPEQAVSGGWTASLAVGATVTNIWNAQIVSHENGVLVIQNVSYNGNLSAGQSFEVGVQGSGSSDGLALISTDLPLPGQDDPGDDQPEPPMLSISDVTVNEGDGTATFVVTASAASGADITVDWQTVSGTAGAADFAAGSGTATITAGDTQTTFTVALTDDAVVEGTETFSVELTSADGATLGDASGTATITDNDDPPDPGDGGDTGDGGDGGEPTNLPELTYEIVNSWSGGFQARIVIENDTDQQLQDWSFTIDGSGFSIGTNIWGGTATDNGDGTITIAAEGWTTVIDPGGQVEFGFNGQGSAPSSTEILSFDPELGPAGGGSGGGSDGGGSDGGGSNGGGIGSGYAEDTGSPFDTSDYGAVLGKSMQFYYAQYSGDLPDDFPIDWRGDSALTDGSDVGLDLTGGWYDAGDHVKFGLPMAYSTSVLAWGGLSFSDGYQASGSYDALVEHLTFVTDYFLRAYDDNGTADIADDRFAAQVGNGHTDHAYWGAPEDMTMERPTYLVTADNPGTEVTAETAAAMAATSMLLREAGDTALADTLLGQAIKLYDFAETYLGNYADAVPNVRSFYNSFSGYEDELSWGANWLYQATGDASYLAKSEAWYDAADANWALSWDDKGHATAVLLAEQTGDQTYVNDVEAHLGHWLSSIDTTPGTDTNEGLAWLDQWGSNRYAANTAFIAAQYAKDLAEADADGNADLIARLRNFASDQIDYMLGDNPDGQSYVVGFGDDYPLNPHHRAASGTTNVNDPDPNAYVLEGALVGGPNAQGSYTDVRSDYIANEVATDYNAGFSGALAALVEGLTPTTGSGDFDWWL